ncbi:MAG: hypothetical protein QM765_19425 [Myxococcales bacterium]
MICVGVSRSSAQKPSSLDILKPSTPLMSTRENNSTEKVTCSPR